MARIAGVDIPQNKRGEIGLTYIFGIGRSTAQKILTEAGIDWDKKVKDWSDDEQNRVRTIIGDNYKVEGGLRSEIQMNIKRLMDIGTYRGIRHRIGLPLILKTMHVPVRAVRKRLPTRKRLLNNIIEFIFRKYIENGKKDQKYKEKSSESRPGGTGIHSSYI